MTSFTVLVFQNLPKLGLAFMFDESNTLLLGTGWFAL